jgi:hypothetical protein
MIETSIHAASAAAVKHRTRPPFNSQAIARIQQTNEKMIKVAVGYNGDRVRSRSAKPERRGSTPTTPTQRAERATTTPNSLANNIPGTQTSSPKEPKSSLRTTPAIIKTAVMPLAIRRRCLKLFRFAHGTVAPPGSFASGWRIDDHSGS